MKLKIITKDEQVLFFKALTKARRASDEPNRTDEDRLKNMELYLNIAFGICGRVRERWGT